MPVPHFMASDPKFVCYQSSDGPIWKVKESTKSEHHCLGTRNIRTLIVVKTLKNKVELHFRKIKSRKCIYRAYSWENPGYSSNIEACRPVSHTPHSQLTSVRLKFGQYGDFHGALTGLYTFPHAIGLGIYSTGNKELWGGVAPGTDPTDSMPRLDETTNIPDLLWIKSNILSSHLHFMDSICSVSSYDHRHKQHVYTVFNLEVVSGKEGEQEASMYFCTTATTALCLYTITLWPAWFMLVIQLLPVYNWCMFHMHILVLGCVWVWWELQSKQAFLCASTYLAMRMWWYRWKEIVDNMWSCIGESSSGKMIRNTSLICFRQCISNEAYHFPTFWDCPTLSFFEWQS